MQEAGVKGYESATWYGIVAPAQTSSEIIARLSAGLVGALNQPDVRERLSSEGADPVGSSPAEFGAHIHSEIEKWRKVIRAAGIQPS